VARGVSLKSPLGVALALVMAGGVAWPVIGGRDRVQTAAVRDDPACPHSGDLPSATASEAARGEILCLLNLERTRFSLPALHEERHLDVAAQVQSDDIARRHFWAHVNPDGRTPAQRIASAGYPPSRATGENLAWGTESEATPVRIVIGWMHSPGHRQNILHPTYTQIGIGVTRGAPQPNVRGRAAIYATTFGGGPLR
jgi:uncharacterized protein YkwD